MTALLLFNSLARHLLLQRNLVVVVLALVGKYQKVWLRGQVQAVHSIAPQYWLNNLGQGQQITLSQNSFGYSVGIFDLLVSRILSQKFLLCECNPCVVILFDLFEIVIAAQNNFFTQEVETQGIGRQSYLLKLFEPFEHILAEGWAREHLDLAWVFDSRHEHPLSVFF